MNKELTIQLPSLGQISLMRLFRRVEWAYVESLTLVSNASRVSVRNPAPTNSTRQPKFSDTIFLIGAVLGLRSETEVANGVIARISVPMIDNLTVCNVTVGEPPRNVVHQDVDGLTKIQDARLEPTAARMMRVVKRIARFLANVVIGPFLSSRQAEVTQRPLQPKYLTGVRFVPEALTQVLKWWNVAPRRGLSFFAHIFAGFSFRRSTATTVTAPSLLHPIGPEAIA